MNKAYAFDHEKLAHDIREASEGWSQRELAELADTGHAVWTRALNCHPIGTENLIKICNLLSLNPTDYVQEVESK